MSLHQTLCSGFLLNPAISFLVERVYFLISNSAMHFCLLCHHALAINCKKNKEAFYPFYVSVKFRQTYSADNADTFLVGFENLFYTEKIGVYFSI